MSFCTGNYSDVSPELITVYILVYSNCNHSTVLVTFQGFDVELFFSGVSRAHSRLGISSAISTNWPSWIRVMSLEGIGGSPLDMNARD